MFNGKWTLGLIKLSYFVLSPMNTVTREERLQHFCGRIQPSDKTFKERALFDEEGLEVIKKIEKKKD